jgi:hypothetical protein
MAGDLPSALILTFILPGWVFKFLCMIYEKYEYYLKRKTAL